MKRLAIVICLLCFAGIAAIVVHLKTPILQGQLRRASAEEVLSQLPQIQTDIPFRFEANQGQTDAEVRFLARGSGYRLFLTAAEMVLVLEAAPAASQEQRNFLIGKPGLQEWQSNGQAVLRMRLVDANPNPLVTGSEEQPGRTHYFSGGDPSRWRTNVPHYSRVEYQGVYSGVDLAFYGNSGGLEYDFVVAPRADPALITLAFEGPEALDIDDHGDLVLTIGKGQVRMHKPHIYQETSRGRRTVDGRFLRKGARQVGFQVLDYDRDRTLVIDPVLAYSTYFGGSDDDAGLKIAVDFMGNVYATGGTGSLDFPGAGSSPRDFSGLSDVFVSKLDPTGAQVIYSTYLGGTDNDVGLALAIDSSGNAYVAGVTQSFDFPVAGPIQPTHHGGGDAFGDAFVAKLDANGSTLLYSTYLGGSADDGATAIAADSSGNAYIAGTTESFDFPTANALQPNNGVVREAADAFVSKLNSSGSALLYSTYLGGGGADGATGIAVDSAGNAYVSGITGSANFPTVNPFQPSQGGFSDGFVSKINASGSALTYSTNLGGSGADGATSIAVDSTGNAYVTGITDSLNFPTVNPLQATNLGFEDVFVTKLNPQGSSPVYSTYLGSDLSDVSLGIAINPSGNAYVTGGTSSSDFPTVHSLQAFKAGLPEYADAFVAKLNPDGSALDYSTYFGGAGNDGGTGIAVDTSGNAYVIGTTDSLNFPTTNSLQTARRGGLDAFLIKILDETPAVPTLLPNAVSNGVRFQPAAEPGSAIAPGSTVSIFGTNLAASSQGAFLLPLPTQLGETSVEFIPGGAAPLFAVSGGEIIALVPFEVPVGQPTIQVRRGNATSAGQSVTVAAAAPSIFTINQQGTGQGVILIANTSILAAPAGSIPGQQARAVHRGEIISIFCTGLGDVFNRPPSGAVAPGDQSLTMLLPTVTIGGNPTPPSFSGLSSYVGLYRVDVQVPPSAPVGDAIDVKINVAGVISNTATIAIQ